MSDSKIVRDFGATPENIKKGFGRIMDGTSIPVKLKNQIYEEFYKSEEQGSSRMLIAAFNLIDEDFSWPFFEKWKAFFEKNKIWPDIWLMEGPYGHEDEDDDFPRDKDDLFRIMKMKDMKEVIKFYNISGNPKNKTHAVELLNSLSLEELLAAPVVEELLKDDYDLEAEEFDFKRQILGQTVATAVYQEEREEQRREMLKDKRPYPVHPVCFAYSECRIEKQIARAFNLNKVQGYPPFFPGDKTDISMCDVDQIKRHGFTSETYKRFPLE